MQSVTQVQIEDKTVCIFLQANAIEKGINSSVVPFQLWVSSKDRLGSLALEKENSAFKPAIVHLKTDFVSPPVCEGGVG